MNTIRELKQQEKYNNMLKRKNKEISILKDDKEHLGEFLKESNEEIERLHSIIKEVREYIENNSLYEQDYDYDYEENLVEYPPSDEQARKDILSILDKEK